jgi:hypothetical protein
VAHPTQTALYYLPSSNKLLPTNNLAEAVVSMVWLLCQPFSFPLALLLLFLVPHLLFSTFANEDELTIPESR